MIDQLSVIAIVVAIGGILFEHFIGIERKLGNIKERLTRLETRTSSHVPLGGNSSPGNACDDARYRTILSPKRALFHSKPSLEE